MDDFFSGPLTVSWETLEPLVHRMRATVGRATISEWFQGLAERMAEGEAAVPPEPAHIAHRHWRPKTSSPVACGLSRARTRTVVFRMTEPTMMPASHPLAVEATAAIHSGDIGALERLVREHPDLPTAYLMDAKGVGRTLLHVVADWPGHVPHGSRSVALLAAAGADLDAPALASGGAPHQETALHWAASSDDVAVLDALLDAGADIEAPGAVFTGGSAMSDAVIFAQWRAARRLLERGARTTLVQAAALGLLERVRTFCEGEPPPSAQDITGAFWHACRAGQRGTAEYLLERGAQRDWQGWDGKTPLDAAVAGGDAAMIQWLQERGARSARDPA